MGRAEKRREEKAAVKRKTVTYNFTKEQLDNVIQEEVGKVLDKIKEKATEDALNTALMLMLTLPLEVLLHEFWPKSYEKKLPKFTDSVLSLYEKWQNGEVDIDVLRKDLWEFGGVRLEEVDVEEKEDI